jgi:hypothetical protein
MSHHTILYLDSSITIQELIRALRFSPYVVSNTVAPHAFVIRPNPKMLTDEQFKKVVDLYGENHERKI